METNIKKVNEFNVGQRVDAYLIIKKVDLKTTNQNGKKYLDFILGDNTGEIVAKLWEVPEALENAFTSNSVVKVRGTVISYQNALQFKIEKIRGLSEGEDVDLNTLVASAPIDPQVMYKTIREKFILPMENNDIRNIVDTIFLENKEALLYYPAAKRNHHSLKGGLLYHILTMLTIGEKFTSIYTFLDKDLLFGGIVLHDMSKIKEMTSSELGIVDEYSMEGTLLGHITQGVKNIDRVAREVNASEEVAIMLEHMVLSHHYEPEFGSPVKPMFKEAELLHFIDVIDARMYDFKLNEDKLNKGEFSDYVFSLDRRRVYKSTLDTKDNGINLDIID